MRVYTTSSWGALGPSSALVWCCRRNWTLQLLPFVRIVEDALVVPQRKTTEDTTVAYVDAAVRCMDGLLQRRSSDYIPQLTTSSSCGGVRGGHGVSLESAPLPGETHEEQVASSFRILAFVQSAAAVAESLVSELPHAECADDGNKRAFAQLRDVALDVLLHYGVFMVHGRTARRVVGLATTQVDVAGYQSSHATAGIVGRLEADEELAKALLHATVAVLRVLQKCGGMELFARSLSTLRVLLRPSILIARSLSASELCDVGFGLACTNDASCTTQGGDRALNASGASFEDNNDWVVLGGELVRRLRLQVTPGVMTAKEFSKSAKFTFSLKERKEREKAEQSASIDENDGSLLTVAELATLATCLGVSQFRDASFKSPDCTSGQLWDWIARATCKLVEAEVRCAEVDSATNFINVSFTRRELQSICFACDHAGQQGPYDTIMKSLVAEGVIGEYIPSPSTARVESFQSRGAVAMDGSSDTSRPATEA